MRIEEVDPRDLDLDTADELAAILTAANDEAGVDMPPRVGAAALTYRLLGHDNRPIDGLWLAWDGDRLVGHLDLTLPHRENTDTARVQAHVHPDDRRRGTGTALLDAARPTIHAAGRNRVYAGAWAGSAGEAALRARGFTATPGRCAVRRIDVHGTAPGRWDRLREAGAAHAVDYDLLHLVGPTPDEHLAAMATLHEAINDAPANDVDEQPALFDEKRVRDYDSAMAGRRQTVYRVVAVHRPSGEWAGLSMLCVDEFAPALAFQEDTSVVRTHRGHRLGLLMKADMLGWLARDRPEVGATDTWNATTNHHMIAVNERLGATVVAEHVGYRLDLA